MRWRRAQIRGRLAGFDVAVNPGFWLFNALLIVVNPWPRGPMLAVASGVLTVVHELGHASAARAFGIPASIQLDGLAGRTLLSPTRRLAPGQRALITLAGPTVHVAVGVAALGALGANPLSWDAVSETDLRMAVFWTGPMLGALNLLPLMPLDGGMLMAAGFDRLAPGRGVKLAKVTSGALVLILAIVLFTYGNSAQLGVIMAAVGAFVIWSARDRVPTVVDPPPGPYVALVSELIEKGQLDQASALGARLFAQGRDPHVAVLMACCANGLSDAQTAMAWLQAAADSGGPQLAVRALANEPQLASLADHPGISTLRSMLRTDA